MTKATVKPAVRPDLSAAGGIASHAATLVSGDRDRQHGDKLANFQNIATLWSAWLANRFGLEEQLTAHDVGILMVLMKCARTISGSPNLDDYVDMAGYAACAGEIIQKDCEGTGMPGGVMEQAK